MIVNIYGILSSKQNIFGLLGRCELETACRIHHLSIKEVSDMLVVNNTVKIGKLQITVGLCD